MIAVDVSGGEFMLPGKNTLFHYCRIMCTFDEQMMNKMLNSSRGGKAHLEYDLTNS
jgi:hypothetical protein